MRSSEVDHISDGMSFEDRPTSARNNDDGIGEYDYEQRQKSSTTRRNNGQGKNQIVSMCIIRFLTVTFNRRLDWRLDWTFNSFWSLWLIELIRWLAGLPAFCILIKIETFFPPKVSRWLKKGFQASDFKFNSTRPVSRGERRKITNSTQWKVVI